MDDPASSPPQRIVHEVNIDMRLPWWQRHRIALIKTGRQLLLGLCALGAMVAIGLTLELYFQPEEGVRFRWPIATTLVACVFLMAYFMVWQAHRRANRAARARLGDVLTQFIAFDPEGVSYGTRGCMTVHVHWDLTKVQWHKKKRRFNVIVAGGSIPLDLEALDPQHVEQIRYWSTRHHRDADTCAACDYDLTGSPGPRCPECGKPIRWLDTPPRPGDR